MEIELLWHEPCLLREAQPHERLIYACDELNRIPARPGIYVFARKHGHKTSPLYVGRSQNLRKRIEQHLEGNIRLMTSIREAQTGQRLLLVGEIVPRQGQKADKISKLLELAYIDHALSAGHELYNDKGTKKKAHTVHSKGRKGYHRPFPRRMNVEIK